ncbi:hypothetical protein [Kamptonema formosum]|uniref:hypothetical protein n=1 Tax=Kamptonema formosum TaxID=331992 RepID=UPI0012DF383B|nr:hypothetical protein [Oscillatoria sp. PCC 10802]
MDTGIHVQFDIPAPSYESGGAARILLAICNNFFSAGIPELACSRWRRRGPTSKIR